MNDVTKLRAALAEARQELTASHEQYRQRGAQRAAAAQVPSRDDEVAYLDWLEREGKPLSERDIKAANKGRQQAYDTYRAAVRNLEARIAELLPAIEDAERPSEEAMWQAFIANRLPPADLAKLHELWTEQRELGHARTEVYRSQAQARAELAALSRDTKMSSPAFEFKAGKVRARLAQLNGEEQVIRWRAPTLAAALAEAAQPSVAALEGLPTQLAELVSQDAELEQDLIAAALALQEAAARWQGHIGRKSAIAHQVHRAGLAPLPTGLMVRVDGGFLHYVVDDAADALQTRLQRHLAGDLWASRDVAHPVPV